MYAIIATFPDFKAIDSTYTTAKQAQVIADTMTAEVNFAKKDFPKFTVEKIDNVKKWYKQNS